MSGITTFGSLNLLPNLAAASNLVADGAYAVQVVVPPALPPTSASSVISIVGGFRRGLPNVAIGPIGVSSNNGIGSVLAAVGDGVINSVHIPYDGVREVNTATPEGVQYVFLPVRDGTQVAATLAVADSTGFATQQVTGGGSVTSGATMQLTIQNGAATAIVVGPVTAGASDTSSSMFTKLAQAVNSSPAVQGASAFLQAATPGVSNIVLTALVSGTAGNSITVYGTATGTVTLGPSSPTAFTGGAAPGTFMTITDDSVGTLGNGMTFVMTLQSGSLAVSPVFIMSLAYPYNGQQTWRNIIGYATPGGAYSPSIAKANAVAAINGTASGQTGSTLVTAAVGASSANPLLGTTQTASGGVDGTTSLTTASLIGVDGNSNRTGMFALRGIPFGVLILAQCVDPTADVQMQSFLSQVGGIGITAFPSGTSTTTAIGQKLTYSLSNNRIMRVMDWVYAPDSYGNNPDALVSPLGAVAGIIASLQPWVDPSNKPDGVNKGNIFGTERTVNNTNPVDPQSEGSQRKSNGFNYITNGQPRVGGLLGLANGKMSDGSNCADIRMFDYIAANVLQILQKYVGKSQLPPPAPNQIDPDPIRRLIRADLITFANTLVNPNALQAAGFGFQFIGTAQQVAAGYCPWAIQGQTLAGIQFAIAQIAVGSNVTPSANA